MADRYWVGGTGTWDATSTANWSNASGGASGASVPTSADNVFFDTLSNTGTTAFTVTITTQTIDVQVCNDLTISGLDAIMTFTINGYLTVYGNWTSQAASFQLSSPSVTGRIIFASNTTQTINANGGILGTAVYIGKTGSTGTVNLGGIITIGNSGSGQALVLESGTFNTQNFQMSVYGLNKTSTGTVTCNLGSSTVFLIAAASVNQISITQPLTFNAGTSEIILQTGTTVTKTISSNQNLTFYNFTCSTGTANADTVTFTGNVNWAFNNFTITGLVGTGLKVVSFIGGTSSVTINGTLTHNTSTVRSRLRFGATTYADQPITLNCGTYNLQNTDIINLTVTGTTLTGTSIGDAGANSGNITFTLPQTWYWSLAAGGSYTSNAYATTSGGSPSTANFALPQDTIIFDDAGLNSGATITMSGSSSSAGFTTVARTLPMTMTWANASTTVICSDVTITSVVTIGAGTGVIGVATRGTNSTTNVDITPSIGRSLFAFIGSRNGKIKLLRNFTQLATTSNGVQLIKGTLDLNGFTLSCYNFTAGVSGNTATNTSVLAFGTNGTLIMTGLAAGTTGFVSNAILSNWSYTGTGTIRGSANPILIANNTGQSFPTIGLNGTATVRIVISTTVEDVVNLSPGTASTLTLQSNTLTVNNFNLSGTAGALISIRSLTSGTRVFLSKTSGTVSCDYLSIQDCGAQGGATWYAGANSINVSNNTGWIFTAPPSAYNPTAMLAFFP